MLIGYKRVSTQNQKLDRQTDLLNEFGVERIFEEKVSGTKRERAELNKMLDMLRNGDVVIVTDLTRLSRSTKDLFSIVSTIENKGAGIKSLKESWLDTTTPQGKLLFTIFAGLSQFERDLTAQRTKEGLISAKKRGKVLGRPPKLNDKKDVILNMYNSNDYSINDIINATGISKTSLYRLVNAQ
jgi:DNA invertase Pin-like site-specific DNA recombinase